MEKTDNQQPKNQGNATVERNALRSIVVNIFSCVVFGGGVMWALYDGKLNWLYIAVFMATSVLSGMEACRVFQGVKRREATSG